jgi:hypothetical protein
MSLRVIWQYMGRSVTKKILYGPQRVRHQKNITWTSEASVHIIFFGWRTGPYTAIWPSVPWTICYILHFTFLFSLFVFVNAAGHYFVILYFTFLFSLFVFVSAAGQYNVIWTGTGLPRLRFGSGTVPALF